jgi:hypothetical protein
MSQYFSYASTQEEKVGALAANWLAGSSEQKTQRKQAQQSDVMVWNYRTMELSGAARGTESRPGDMPFVIRATYKR